MPIRHPLCPYDRHPLLEPEVWIERLYQSNRAIADGRSELIFTASNSFALLLTHCGMHEVAAKVLRSSVQAALRRPEPAPYWFDSFFNFLRMANRSGDETGFQDLLYVCVDALKKDHLIILPESILGFTAELSLKNSLGVLLRQHLIYEVMVHNNDGRIRNEFVATCLDSRLHFETAGLIFREFIRFAPGETIVEAGSLFASPGGSIEGLIRALYAFETLESDQSYSKAHEFLAIAAVLFMTLARAGKIDQRCLRIVETLADQARRAGRQDVENLVLDAGLMTVGEDWYMSEHLKAIRAGMPAKTIKEAYCGIRPALQELSGEWTPFVN